MKIWIFNHYAVGPNSSGITRHFDLGRELVKLGHEVTIFASSFNHQKREEQQEYSAGQYFTERKYEGVDFVWIKTPAYSKNDFNRIKNMVTYTFKALKLGKRKNDSPDVVIGSLMHPLAAIVGYMVAKKHNSKFYFEERDLWPQSLIDLGKVSSKNPVVTILSRLELFLYQKADKIIVLFDKAPDYVVNRGVSRDKVIYLPNGADINRYDHASVLALPTEFEDTFKENEGKFKILYTGAHGLANHLEALLDIAKIIKDKKTDIQFIFVGDGPVKEKLIQQAAKEGIDNITFLPPVAKEYIPSILKRADAGIMALKDIEVYKWGISLNKMFDYMAAGIPIIMLSSLKDTSVSRENLGVVSNDKKELVENIIRLSENRSEAQKMGDRGAEFVRLNHSWKHLALKLDEEMREKSIAKD